MSPYSYNSSNQLTSTPSATFTYDGNGNAATKADANGATTYTWDFENRLTSVVLPASGGTVTFMYDPFGRRIQKSSSSDTTIYLYDGSNSVEEVGQAGAELVHYSQGAGIDEPLAATRNGTVGFYEQDDLGSVTTLSDSTGAVLNSYTYDSFGNLAASTGAFVNPFLYTGRDYDSETGLQYYRARYYDPSVGRFVSEDPARAGDNFYVYVGNDPIDFIDPYGLIRRCITKVMLVTAYSDRGPGKDWPYFAPKRRGGKPGSVGMGTVAVANSNPQPYPFGADVIVSGPLVDPVFDPRPIDPFNTPAYVGQVHDTGAGWDANHHHVQPDDWIDIWLPSRREALKWGTQWRQVTICYEDGCKQ